MQSRVLAIRSSWLRSLARSRLFPISRLASSTAISNGAGDTAIHSEDPQGEEANEASKAAMAEQRNGDRSKEKNKESSPTANTQFVSSPKLENSSINSRVDPSFQQKRSCHSAPAARAVEEVSCVGWDGAPVDDGRWGEVQAEEDDRDYYKERRPSPLSEIEFADTRVPIRRATDKEVVADEYGGGSDIRVWREEQLDTAEDALLRAEAMFMAARERGDPDSPQSRVLARLKGQCV